MPTRSSRARRAMNWSRPAAPRWAPFDSFDGRRLSLSRRGRKDGAVLGYAYAGASGPAPPTASSSRIRSIRARGQGPGRRARADAKPDRGSARAGFRQIVAVIGDGRADSASVGCTKSSAFAIRDAWKAPATSTDAGWTRCSCSFAEWRGDSAARPANRCRNENFVLARHKALRPRPVSASVEHAEHAAEFVAALEDRPPAAMTRKRPACAPVSGP